ncbi:MAG: hypothetical protein AB7O98_15100 [Hyphomonadaceae bacterium]
MNTVQALAIAAAAWVAAGDMWSAPIERAQVQFELIAARSEAISIEAMHALPAYLGKTPDGDCMLRAPIRI